MVTGATYHKQPFFDTPAKLDLVRDTVLQLAGRYGWLLQAWAVFSNYYHFVALVPPDLRLSRFISHLHTSTASGARQHGFKRRLTGRF